MPLFPALMNRSKDATSREAISPSVTVCKVALSLSRVLQEHVAVFFFKTHF